jgi:hypothetical protein
METFHLYHLAACWGGRQNVPSTAAPPPLTRGPALSTPSYNSAQTPTLISTAGLAQPDSVIRVAAAQLVFASRTSQHFITPEEVTELENWTGKGVLEALIGMAINSDVSPFLLHYAQISDPCRHSYLAVTFRERECLGTVVFVLTYH